MSKVIRDSDRYPTLTDHGRSMLRFLREHPHAPLFRNESGNRLTAEDVERVRAHEREALSASVGWRPGTEPTWLLDFVNHCLEQVPHYRRYGAPPARFTDLPTIDRGDLGRDVAQFVPDDVPIDRLINFRTSGTTGHALLLASHPVVAASYLAFHKRALRHFGIELRHGRGQVGVVLLGWQRRCFTYVSVTPTMDESGLAKINLHPDDWRDPDDRARYLDALAPEVLAGDPISFAELLSLPLTHRPRAILSTSMSLSDGLRRALQERFVCPVLDLYSMNEAGPIGVHDDELGGHLLLQPRLYVELLDGEGKPAATGARGEVTLTGGFNFCLPLLRYRTGDHASLALHGELPVLVGLEGRPPVRFRTSAGAWINNIEVTHVLRPFAIPQWALHQAADGSLHCRLFDASSSAAQVERVLRELFGAGTPLRVKSLPRAEGKVVQYTSELEGATP